jgi:ABC-type Zn uptake system ZnuABC Zn-binding protein ZnuA
MKKNNVKVVLAANYFSQSKVRQICSKVGAIPVIVPMYVHGAPGADDVFKLMDMWITKLNQAFQKAN